MPLVPMRAILEATEKYNYAQGAFNVKGILCFYNRRYCLCDFIRAAAVSAMPPEL